MNPVTFSRSMQVPDNHACFAGHFPGNPILPGVLLLERVMICASERFGRGAVGCVLQNVKFPAPVLPGDQIDLQLLGNELGECKFTVHAVRLATPAILVCSGQLRMASSPRSDA